MSQTYEQSEAPGINKELPQVTVVYLGDIPLRWECQNYVPGKNLRIELLPGERDKFDYDYARRVFGDWEVNPDESRQKKKEWSGMINLLIRRSPSMDGMLPKVKIYDPDNNLLWDTQVQMERWLEHNAREKDGFGRIKGSPLGGVVPMPEILASATYDQLKALWLESWGSKMPAGTKAEVAREILKPRLTAKQIQDVIAREYEAAREGETEKAAADSQVSNGPTLD